MPSLAVSTVVSHDPPIASKAVLKLDESSVSESKGVGDIVGRIGESVQNGCRMDGKKN